MENERGKPYIGNDDRLNNNEWNGFPQRMVCKRNVRRLRAEGIVTEEPRLTIKERSLEIIRKLRCAGRVLKEIPVPKLRRGAEAAPHADFAHLLLPQKNCLSNERRLRKMIEYKMKTKKNMKNTNISTSTGTKNETFREKYTGTLRR